MDAISDKLFLIVSSFLEIVCSISLMRFSRKSSNFALIFVIFNSSSEILLEMLPVSSSKI